MIDLVSQYLGEMAPCIAGRWQVRFAEPDPRRWALTAGYLFAALMVVATARRRTADGRDGRRLLVGMALVLLFLGINKQVDLQTLVRAVGHCESRRAGWYADRNSVRQPIAAAVIASMGLGALWVAALHRRVVFALADMLFGLGLLLGYLGVRLAAWNKLGNLLDASPSAAALLPLAEPVGLGAIVLGAARRLLRGTAGARLNGPAPPSPG